MKLNIKEIDILKIEALEKELTEFPLSRELLAVLVGRGVDTPAKIKAFLVPKLFDLTNPFTINDMQKAIRRVKKALKKNEKILIYGDKDVDGQTSISLLKTILIEYGANVDFYVPVKEGYGLHKSILGKLLEEEIGLVITVDCGITNVEEVKYLKENGVDIIITDHHEPLEIIPAADAVVDPKINGGSIKDLAGCGVVFYFCWALVMSFTQYFDKIFVAIDTETTGLKPGNDEITELGAVKIKNGIIIEKFNSFINVGVPISAYITQLTGITENDCRNAPKVDEVAQKFKEFISDADCAVFHNASFDMRFIKETPIYDVMKDLPVVDTLLVSRRLYPKISHKLGKLAEFFRLPINNLHRAADDAELTALIHWKLLLKNEYAVADYFKKYISYASLGTISDIMPLTDDNRFIVKYGLHNLKNSNIKGMKTWLEKLVGETNKLNATFVAWNLTPVLNSAGRMEKPELGVEFLCATSALEAMGILKEIETLNKARRRLQTKNAKTVEKMIEESGSIKNADIIFVAHKSLNKNVTGIVANNIMKKHKKPTFIMAKDDGESTGSVRAPKGHDMVSWLESCSECLERFGGHKLAGGYTVKNENIKEFRDKLLAISGNANIAQDDFVNVDLMVESNEFSTHFMKEVFLLEPFGQQNQSPVFLIKNCEFIKIDYLGVAKAHLKGAIKIGDGIVEVIAWSLANKLVDIKNINFVDIIGSVEKNYYNGQTTMRINITEFIL
jgi:single-stranded-DNA-specific exonuclease